MSDNLQEMYYFNIWKISKKISELGEKMSKFSIQNIYKNFKDTKNILSGNVIFTTLKLTAIG